MTASAQHTVARRPRFAEERPRRQTPAAVNALFAAICLYLFLCAINVMGSGLKLLGASTDWLDRLIAHGGNPFIALMGSVLVTAIVQSSSFTTSLIIALVGVGEMELETAVFAVMGANIGTSVTNIIVALGNVRIRRQFRRAFTAALVHDIFNWLTVAILFPLEWITSALTGTGLLARAAGAIRDMLGLGALDKPANPIKLITTPVVSLLDRAGELLIAPPGGRGLLIACLGLLLLFSALVFLVRNLKGALLRRIEGLFTRVFFRTSGAAYVVGAIATILVQSSSVTTSLIVPLAGAGAVKLKRVYPYTLGANLGTTVTGVIAATANPVPAALGVAIAHVLFNLIGTLIWYPLGFVPLSMARWYGRLASQSRRYAFLFLLLVFVVIPVVGLIITELLI